MPEGTLHSVFPQETVLEGQRTMSHSFIFQEAVQGGGWEPGLWNQAGQLRSQHCAHLP